MQRGRSFYRSMMESGRLEAGCELGVVNTES